MRTRCIFLFILATIVFASCGDQSNSNANLEQIQASIDAYNCSDGRHLVVETFDDEDYGFREVDLGLSVKWASCNLGTDKAEESGPYIAWGELKTKKDYNANNSTTFSYSLAELKSKKVIDKKENLLKNYDIATQTLGEGWRLPTKEEAEELIKKCEWTWMVKNGTKGYKVTGPNRKYIFIPAKGYYYEQQIYDADDSGNYWTSSAYDNRNFSMGLTFTKRSFAINSSGRSGGRCIRPVYTK